ncbi:MAG: CapA family protein [Clostridiales bacterium]|nr:CapA family protein [Clostridiales bacterium]
MIREAGLAALPVIYFFALFYTGVWTLHKIRDTTAAVVLSVVTLLIVHTDDPAAEPESAHITETETETYTEPRDDTLTISFVGDCMFASDHGTAESGSFNLMAQKQPADYFLRNFIPMFSEDDFTIANCECVLSDGDLTAKPTTGGRSFRFKGPARHAEIFSTAKVEFASVVNNHTHDYGQQGSDDTEAALESAGVLPGRRDEVTYATVKGQKLGIFCDELVSYSGVKAVTEKVREMQREDCDLIILYFHSGLEYKTAPEKWLVRAFHEIIDAGADIIVSSHPHVLQPMEVYNDKPILYSLGNFCFGGNYHPPVETAVYQAVYKLRDGEITQRSDVLIPCATYAGKQNNFQPYIVTDEAKKQEILDLLNSPVRS